MTDKSIIVMMVLEGANGKRKKPAHSSSNSLEIVNVRLLTKRESKYKEFFFG